MFAKSLEESLHLDTELPSSLTSNLYRQINDVLLISKATATNKNYELDNQGTTLWNLASKYKQDRSISPELFCLCILKYSPISLPSLTEAVRVFPCMLLDCAQRWNASSIQSETFVTIICAFMKSNTLSR